MRLRVAAVVCTRDRPRDLRRLLDSLERQDHPLTELVVVDAGSGSPPETPPLLSARVTYLTSPTGLPVQRNTGVANLRTSPEIVCFLDDDVELEPGYLQAVVARFAADREAGGRGGRVVGVCGNATNETKRHLLSRLVRRFFFITDNWSGRLLPSGDAGHVFAPTHDRTVAVLSGCNMCFRGDLFRVHRLRFDEALAGYAYMEDQDFSLRAGRYGALVQLAAARLTHHSSLTGRPGQKQLFETYVVNSFYLLRKNLHPGLLGYLCYGWRLVGKLLHAVGSGVATRSFQPIAGWLTGVAHIRRIERAAARHG